MKKLILISPFVDDVCGHYYPAARCLYLGTKAHGMDFTALVMKDSLIDDVWAKKVFTQNMSLPPFTIKRLYMLLRKLMGKSKTYNSGGGVVIRRVKQPSKMATFFINVIDILNVIYMNIVYYRELKLALKNENLENIILYVETPRRYFMIAIWYWWHRQSIKPVLFLNTYAPLKKERQRILWLFKNIATFICHAKNITNEYKKYIKTGHVQLMNPAFEISNIPLKSDRVESDKLRIGFVGTFRESRGILTAINVIKSLVADSELNKNIQFIIQCTPTYVDVPIANAIEQLQELSKNNENLIQLVTHKVGPDEYYKLISSIDIMLLPYSDEYGMIFSGIMCESSVCGTVSIAPYYIEPSNREHIECILSVMDDSSEEFINALKLLLKNPEKFKELSKRCRKYQSEHLLDFSPELYVKKLLDFMKG
jgi:glycosyltransferase involved in cell wall biosynthesis